MNRFFKIAESGLRKSDFIDADPNVDLSGIDDDFCVHSLSDLENARNGDLSFFTITMVSGDKYRHLLENTKASFCLLKAQYANVNCHVKPIITDEPYITFMRLCKKVFIKKTNDSKSVISKSAIISERATIGDCVKIGDNVIIEDFVKIGDGVEIGNNCIIKSGVKIGYNCVIGDNCCLLENCVIKYTEIGDNCCIHSNSTIGQDGFGYVFDRRSNKNEKIYHFGCVKIGNNVEIGSNTCIDRSVFNETVIEDGVKIDNLVQIAHNVKVGPGSVIAGQAGIAGSATIGKYCMIGGKSGINGHITIGDQCIIYGATNVAKDFSKHSKIIGTPGDLYHIWVKNYAIMQHFLKKKRRKLSKQSSGVSFLSYINNLFKLKR